MKLINKSNFISIVCTSFTLIVCGKLLLEKISGFKDKYYTENIFTCLAFSIVITLILSLHYYLQQFPFIPVFIGQYVVTIGIVFLTIWISSHFTDIAPTGYRDMFYSVSIPFVVGAAVYYICFFHEIRKANKMIEKLVEE